MKLTITIHCDTAAFGPTYGDAAMEAARILGDVAMKLNQEMNTPQGVPQQLYDLNESAVGRAKWTGVTAQWLKDRP